MVNQSYGLRFDIYERVHLSDEMVGIEELEEIELFPKIQVIPGEDYAALRGHLLLSGLYRGDNETRELEHWIPVEITIPLSRVNKLEDIAVEIENFDVDLLSARSLNITGVLSLQGIETTSATADPQDWNDREYVVSHEAYQVPQSQQQEQIQQLEQIQQDTPDWSYSQAQSIRSDSTEWLRHEGLNQPNEGLVTDEQEEVLSWNNSFASPVFANTTEDSAKQEDPEEQGYSREPEASIGEPEWQQDISRQESSEEAVKATLESHDISLEVSESTDGLDETQEAAQPLEEDLESSRPQSDEKKELKIALGSKKNDTGTSSDAYGISHLIPSNRIVSDLIDQEQLNKENEESPVSYASDGEELQWKKLFIRSGEHEPFRKVKLVIVQQEETLDDIAQRYHLSSRELQLYNRLPEPQLAEGQILYIP